MATRRKTRSRTTAPSWLIALDEDGRACDRDNTFSLRLARDENRPPERLWSLTLRKGKWRYRKTHYKSRENGLRGARKLYGDLMREQPTGDHGHEVHPGTTEPLDTCGCMKCTGPERGSSEEQTARENAEEWAPTWSVAGLKKRGWTAAMIRDQLGEPDGWADNPHYRSAAPMQLYRQERVEHAEQNEGFAKRRALAATRRQRGSRAAVKAIATRTSRLKEWAQNVEIRWITAPDNAKEALQHGLESWEQWNDEPADKPDQETRKRWARNYIRHQCLNYEDMLAETITTQAGNAAYRIIRERCEALIDQRYPALA